MDSDFVYSFVIDSSWFFFVGWLIVLMGAGIRVLRPQRQHSATGASTPS